MHQGFYASVPIQATWKISLDINRAISYLFCPRHGLCDRWASPLLPLATENPMCKSPVVSDAATRRRMQTLFVYVILSVFLGGATGCRTTSDNQIDLLERELRVQEDYIYELEGYLVDYSDKLRDCRGCSPSQTAVYSEEVYAPAYNPSSIKHSADKRAKPRRSNKGQSIVGEPGSSSKGSDSREQAENNLPVPDSQPVTPDFNPEDMDVPDIEMELDDPLTEVYGVEDAHQLATIELEYESAGDGPMIIPDPVDFNESYADTALQSPLDDESFEAGHIEQTAAVLERVPERLEVKHLFRSEGDEQSPRNLLTVVEALDANDEPVDLNGEISLMVMTPEENGKLRRVKRWNFTPEETVAAWQTSDLGDGLHLELPLEKVALPESDLQLWVRLVTKDNTKLLTKLPFETTALVAMNDQKLATVAAVDELAAAETKMSSINPLRTATKPIPAREKVKLAESKSPSTPSGWRRATNRLDRPTPNLVTTSATSSNGWKKQSPARLQYR